MYLDVTVGGMIETAGYVLDSELFLLAHSAHRATGRDGARRSGQRWRIEVASLVEIDGASEAVGWMHSAEVHFSRSLVLGG